MTITRITRTALYYRPKGKRGWVLWDIYPTREEAFRAVDTLPTRHPVFRLEEVPLPKPQTDPTRDPLGVQPWG